MNEILATLGSTTSQIGIMAICFRFVSAIIVSLFILFIYKLTYSGVAFSKSFAITLVMTCIVTAAILMVINSNLALSLGMVGALSIIRFRSAIKDPRDVGFLFWAVAGGLATGTGLYQVAIPLCVVMAIILIAFRFINADSNTYMLVIKGDAAEMPKAEDTLNDTVIGKNNSAKVVKRFKAKVKNITPTGAEFIYEVTLAKNSENALMASLQKALPEAYVNLISKTGDTTI